MQEWLWCFLSWRKGVGQGNTPIGGGRGDKEGRDRDMYVGV